MSEDDRYNYLHDHPTGLTTDQEFRILLRTLRRDFPTDYPVKVKRVHRTIIGGTPPYYGTAHLVNEDKPKEKRYYLITINNSHPWKVQLDTILHEWAHCLTWFQCPEDSDHPDIFARKYGVLYRAIIEQ
jgi:hypothetical protein